MWRLSALALVLLLLAPSASRAAGAEANAAAEAESRAAVEALLSPLSFAGFMAETYALDVRHIAGNASRVAHLQEAADLRRVFDAFKAADVLRSGVTVSAQGRAGLRQREGKGRRREREKSGRKSRNEKEKTMLEAL